MTKLEGGKNKRAEEKNKSWQNFREEQKEIETNGRKKASLKGHKRKGKNENRMTGATYIQIRMTGGAGDDVVGLGGVGVGLFFKSWPLFIIFTIQKV